MHCKPGRSGQGREGKGRAGKGKAGQGRAGKSRAGQGRAGQGRAESNKARYNEARAIHILKALVMCISVTKASRKRTHLHWLYSLRHTSLTMQ